MKDIYFKEFMKEQKFKKLLFYKVWGKNGWWVFKHKNYLELYNPAGKKVGRYLIYNSIHNFIKFRWNVRDLVK